MADEPVDPAAIVRAAVETLVFAPIGLGAALVEDAPRAFRRVRQELSNARLVGRLAVEQGAVLRRQRAEPMIDVDEGQVSGEPGDLAIDGYDAMPAIEIVSRLESLSPEQLTAIADHESANRRRRTVLGKIAQLGEA